MKLSIPKCELIAILALAATLFPVVWMTLSSLKTEDEIYRSPPTWIPEILTLTNYRELFTRFDFGRLTVNSAIIAAGSTAISVMVGTMAAYGFSRYSFRGSGMLLTFILLTRMIMPAALVIPLYTTMRTLGLFDNVCSIIIGVTLLNLPFAIWIMKPFLDALPRDVEDAAKIDGLSPIRILWNIVIPMAKPAIAGVVLFCFIAGWVDFLYGISFSTTTQSMPLTVGIARMDTGLEIYWGPMMAGGVYLTIPSLAISFALQKYLVKGLAMGY